MVVVMCWASALPVGKPRPIGIGNLYKNEVLFVERVNPWLPVGAVRHPDRLIDRARQFLLANRDHPEQSTTGLLGRDQAHWVYQRAGQPCRRCRTPISMAEQGTPGMLRATYWCSTCQPPASGVQAG